MPKFVVPKDEINLLIEYHNLTLNEGIHLCRNSKPICKCGNIKNLRKSSQSLIGIALARTCGNRECEPLFGKKRPEHSKTMKRLVVEGSEQFRATLMQKGKLHNKEINSISFKRKRLKNHGFDIEGLTDAEILTQFSKLSSSLVTNIDRRRKEIVNRFNNWEEDFKKLILLVTNNIQPTYEWVDELTENEITELWKRIHGINTIRNWTRVKKTRPWFFKHEILQDFKFNRRNQEQIYVRSGFEKSFVDFFEDNQIPWEYETLRLETIDRTGFHIPDFIIELNNQLLILETKGSFYRQPFDEYYKNKIMAAIEFANKNGFGYILTQKNPDKNFKFIQNALIKIGIKEIC